MANRRVISVYRGSILLQSVLLPSALYGLSFATLALSFLCWLKIGDYLNLKKIVKEPQILFPVLLYCVVLIGFFFSVNFKEALSSLSDKLAFLLFPLIVGSASIIDSKLVQTSGKILITTIVFSLLAALVYAFVDVFKTGINTVLIKDNLCNKFTSYGLTRIFYNWHPTNVSLFANLAIASIFYLINCEKINKKRIGFYAAIVLFLSICIFLLDSVAGIVIYFLMLMFGLFMWLKRLGLRLVTIVTIVLCLFSVGIGFFYVNPFKSDKLSAFYKQRLKLTDIQSERNFVTIRLAKWDGYTEIIKHHWLLGTTEGDIKTLRKQAYIQSGYFDLARYNYNAHNEYIEVLATYGIIGILLFISLLLSPLRKNSYHSLYLPFLIICSVVFVSESLLNRQQGILFFMFYYSLLTHFSFRKNG